MKKSTIVLLIALVMFLCGVGCTVYGVTSQMDKVADSSENLIDSAGIKKIEIDALASSVEIKPSPDDKIHITYKDALFCKFNHTVKDGELKIECTDVIPHISFGITFGTQTSSKVVVLIPDYTTAKVDVELDVGAFSMKDITVAGNISVESDAGEIKLENVNGVTASLKNDVGTVKVNNCNFDALDVSSDVGNIELEKLDCKDISLTNDVGDIKGTLCGSDVDYTIDCESDIGDCNISDRVGGERKLKIKSSIGDINIKFENT